MAQVSKVVLQIGPGSVPDKRKITVNYQLAFSASEVGQKFKLAIHLFGEDKPGDDEKSVPIFGTTPKPIYTFSFGQLPVVIKTPFKTVTAQAEAQSFSESREVNRETLNEDPGSDEIQIPIPNPPFPPLPGGKIEIPHSDEVYAVVSIIASEARSPTQPVK